MTGNRLLVATAVAHYPKAPRWDRPGLVAAREEIIRCSPAPSGTRNSAIWG